jgi:hypothetical protein
MRLKNFSTFFFIFLLVDPTMLARYVDGQSRLFKRYDPGAAYNTVTEDALTLSISVVAKERARVVVRVCSKEPMPFALATAGADPFHIAEKIAGGPDYSPEQVIFLRSEDCLSKYPSTTATEIWAIPEGASLPPHVEALSRMK